MATISTVASANLETVGNRISAETLAPVKQEIAQILNRQ